MSDTTTTVEDLKRQILQFIDERDWRKYHNAKDVALALSVEASELLEGFLWRRPEDLGENDRVRLKEELADVTIYCLSLALAMGVDVSDAVREKIRKNAEKYPADLYRGKARL